jgi:DNA-binding beta-propeller fold protein YncE
MRTPALFSVLIFLCLPAATFAQPPAQTPPPPCVPAGPSGNVQFVCGHTAPEDLVLVPGSEWIVASSYGGTGGIRIVNVKTKVTTLAYPSSTAKEQQDTKTYAACPGPPDAAQKAMFTTHGLALREGKNGLHTLYVVNHNKRESIEVFELDAKLSPPVLTWIGCAVAPDPIGLNEVLPLPDGGFIGTDFLARGDASLRAKMTAGEVNGALWEWHTGKGWTKIPSSETSGANGLELSKDGKWLYVAAWGSQRFFRLSLGQSPVKREEISLPFRPDNVRWAPDGKLYVTGQGGAGQMQTTNIVKIDPDTLKVTEIRTEPNTPGFGAGTVTVQIGKELWVGSYRGDRIAIFPAP